MSEPWKECGWTKARYFSFIRSALRKATMRYPAKQAYLNKACRPAPKGSRFKYVADCEICGTEVGKSKAEVDHIDGAGSLTSYQDLVGFTERLFCGFDNFQILCGTCHSIKSYADKQGVSFDEAALEKLAIAFCKLRVDVQKEYLLKRGCSDKEVSNAKLRRECYKRVNSE